jgi:transposase InsO family protein
MTSLNSPKDSLAMRRTDPRWNRTVNSRQRTGSSDLPHRAKHKDARSGFCLAALEAAFRFGQPEIWNSDQGSQFTSADFLAPLKKRGVSIGMDGRDRALDNVFIERLWRSLKYELIYPADFANGADLFQALGRYFRFQNHQRPNQALGYRTPADLFPRRPTRKRSSP